MNQHRPLSIPLFIASLPVAQTGFAGNIVQPSRPPHHFSTIKRRCRRSPYAHASPSSKPNDNSDLWAQIASAVPLSRAFADAYPSNPLTHISAEKHKLVCPFHNDKNPSLHLDDSKALFHCFACGASGTIINFEQLRSGHRSVSRALQSLASRYPPIAQILKTSAFNLPKNAPLDSANMRQAPSPPPPQRIPRRVLVTHRAIATETLRHCVNFYQRQLLQPSKASSRALRYLLHDRGLSETTIRAYACGYAPPSNRADLTLRYLAITSYPPEHAVLAGVARSPKENVYIDIFRDRVITPIRDVHGSTIALAGRVLPGAPPKAPKYINGPETAIFKKTKTLFGADIAKEAPSAKADHGYIFVVEGYMDVLTIFEKTQGRIACVATMGTSVTVAQLNAAYDLLADPADAKIVINFDSDDAGFKAVERLCDSVIPRSVCPHCIYIAFPPNPMKDSDEFLRVVGKAEEYVQYLLDTAQPWYEWCGSRIVQPEVQRLSELEETEFEEDPRIKQLNDAAMKYLDPKEKTFDFILAEYLRRQRDDILIAYGAPQDILGKGDKKGWPACSEDVIEKLASLVATASLILPGLNKSALIHSWADSLSGGRPTVLTPLFARIVKRCDDICKPWEETSVASQVYWMPPPPWVVEELPKDKQKTLGSEKGYVPPGEESDLDLMLADPKRFKRSMDKMRHQEKHILPGIRERQGDKTKMLKAAPRRAAEEIIIRTLIFASELDRLDAMALLLKVLDRCATRKLPFWTSRAREAVFDYLGSLEGSVSPDEMVAYLEDMEWWCAEVEELFTPIDTEADVEWKEVRQFEEKEPVEIVRSASMSVETMQGKVQSRLALQESGELMKSLMVTKGDMKTGKLANDPQTMEEMKKIVARQVSLRKEIDRSSFLNPEELEERDSQFEEIDAEIDLLERKKWLLENVKTQSIPFPDSGMEKQE